MTIIDDGNILKKVNIRWMQNNEFVSYLLGSKNVKTIRLNILRGIELYSISMLQSISNNQIRESVRLKVLYGK
jgi:hypothetical protein